MTEKDLLKMRRDYKKIQKKYQEELENASRYQELLKEPLVKEFLKLQQYYKKYMPINEDKIIDSVIPEIHFDSAQVYMGMGNWRKEEPYTYNEEYLVPWKDPYFEYKKYRNIETREWLSISKDVTDAFETSATILFPKLDNFGTPTLYELEEIYYKLRRWYFRQLLTMTQQELLQILKNEEIVILALKEEGISLVRKS